MFLRQTSVDLRINKKPAERNQSNRPPFLFIHGMWHDA